MASARNHTGSSRNTSSCAQPPRLTSPRPSLGDLLQGGILFRASVQVARTHHDRRFELLFQSVQLIRAAAHLWLASRRQVFRAKAPDLKGPPVQRCTRPQVSPIHWVLAATQPLLSTQAPSNIGALLGSQPLTFFVNVAATCVYEMFCLPTFPKRVDSMHFCNVFLPANVAATCVHQTLCLPTFPTTAPTDLRLPMCQNNRSWHIEKRSVPGLRSGNALRTDIW